MDKIPETDLTVEGTLTRWDEFQNMQLYYKLCRSIMFFPSHMVNIVYISTHPQIDQLRTNFQAWQKAGDNL